MKKYNKILILGSGALKIGEAGEFDYSGSQAIKAIKEEGTKTIVINPNIATVQTDKDFSDKVYFYPVKPKYVEKVIKIEKPDAIFLSFGGQTALNCGIALEKLGIIKKYNLEVLGTPIKSIELTEDRKKFNQELSKLGYNFPKSIACFEEKAAIKAAKKIGYPVLIRAAFALGGKGSGIVQNKKELTALLKKSFAYSNQVLVEENLTGWKEVEYEVVRDKNDNCITVCNMENIDPLGIHTGDSIVVAPSQTLNNKEYQLLRDIAIKTIKHLGIIGECNIQYAFNPQNLEYKIIEVNARLSRSSALASKATGYPLAYVAAKLGLGYTLDQIKNNITQTTTSFFEPALDYVVLKFPRWDLRKFEKVENKIGSEMKSVGEVMSIGKTIEEILQKAVRSLDINKSGLISNKLYKIQDKDLSIPTTERIFHIAQAFNQSYTLEKIHNLTKIDKFFLSKTQNIVNTFKELQTNSLTKELLLKAKQQGFSDLQISEITKNTSAEILKLRKKYAIKPHNQQIDTLAAEFPCQTNYLYNTYNANISDVKHSKIESSKKILIVGSGTYRIGSSVEFDWACVNAAKTFNKLGYKTIMLNYNPETVSTDYDICHKLYFEEISLESILEIYEAEKPEGVLLFTSGQIGNNLAMDLHKKKIKVIGPCPTKINLVENRNSFSQMLDDLNIPQPEWTSVQSMQKAKHFAEKVGYPVLIRPSFVLSGAAMKVCMNEKQLEKYLSNQDPSNLKTNIVCSKFELNSQEFEVDAIIHNGKVIFSQFTEHLEKAGVHSGDSTLFLPPKSLEKKHVSKASQYLELIAKKLNFSGPINIQFLISKNEVKIIEANLRVSRSFPLISKATNINLIEIAIKSILNISIKQSDLKPNITHKWVKAAQFSFSRLKGADPVLAIEMKSTGEVACYANSYEQAFIQALEATQFKIPNKTLGIHISNPNQASILEKQIKHIQSKQFEILVSNSSKDHFQNSKFNFKYYNLNDQINEIDLLICIENDFENSPELYTLRKNCVEKDISLITNLEVANYFLKSLITEF